MAEAFGRDPILERTIRGLVAEHGIKTVIETGSWRGYTTRRFSEFVGEIHSIEANPETLDIAERNCIDTSNVWLHEGESQHLIRGIIRPRLGRLNHPVLYYLDAHWNKEWPLFDELEAIAELDHGPCVIVIHDAQVPGKDFGFDSYGGQALTFDFVRPYLDKLKFKWTHFFNSEADGHRRGVLFVVPCER